MGVQARSARCPNCARQDKWRWIDLKPPYICKVCGYSMLEKRCINYPKDIILPLRQTEESAGQLETSKPRISSGKQSRA